MCNEADVYIISKEQAFDQEYTLLDINTFFSTFRDYQRIERVLPLSGESDKMYLLNHNLDADLIITLELYHRTDNEV